MPAGFALLVSAQRGLFKSSQALVSQGSLEIAFGPTKGSDKGAWHYVLWCGSLRSDVSLDHCGVLAAKAENAVKNHVDFGGGSCGPFKIAATTKALWDLKGGHNFHGVILREAVRA